MLNPSVGLSAIESAAVQSVVQSVAHGEDRSVSQSEGVVPHVD